MTLRVYDPATNASRDATSGEVAQARSDIGAAAADHTHSEYAASAHNHDGSYAAAAHAHTPATQAEAEAGAENTKPMSALRVLQSIIANAKSATLTGLAAGTNAVIAAADTILVALAKLQAQITALTAVVATKATPLAPVDINAATVLTYADHANRQLRYSGADSTKSIPTDAGTDDAFWLFITANDSAGNITVTTPDGKSITGSPSKAIGIERKGLNVYTVGTTDPSPGGAMTGAEIEAALNTRLGGTAWQAGAAGIVPVTVSGLTPIGSVLTRTMGAGWVSTSRNWTRNGANIAGATGTTYTTVEADALATVTCVEAGLPYIPTGITVDAAVVLPTLVSAAVNGTTLTLVWSQALTSANPATTGGLVLTASGGASAVSGVTNAGTTTTATLARSIANGETLTLAYTSGSSTVPFASASGAAANFSGSAVTNNTAAGGAGPAWVQVKGSFQNPSGGGSSHTLAFDANTGADRCIGVMVAVPTGSAPSAVVGNLVGGGTVALTARTTYVSTLSGDTFYTYVAEHAGPCTGVTVTLGGFSNPLFTLFEASAAVFDVINKSQLLGATAGEHTGTVTTTATDALVLSYCYQNTTNAINSVRAGFVQAGSLNFGYFTLRSNVATGAAGEKTVGYTPAYTPATSVSTEFVSIALKAA